ncbi:hypothetical protein [Pedobacter miscanthi]|uniref:hypothetical protein n=1 Tax=Pedobacter miscanthi TaxID=2259170 RepID=UPI002931DF83|nr:hypothetical protein [Pedobacter miscanthi]
MEGNGIMHYFKAMKKWGFSHRSQLLLGSILGFSLTAAFLLGRKKSRLGTSVSQEPNLNMERYVFEIPTGNGPVQAVVESSGECYSVKFDGRYIGTMWREGRGMKWNTHDEDLKPYLWDISNLLSGAFSRKGFPSLLKGAYPEIRSTEWKGSETLEVVISDETDLEVFSTFLKDEILNLVDFEEHLDLVVKKAGNAYFVLVGIN